MSPLPLFPTRPPPLTLAAPAASSNFDNSVQRIKMWVSDKPSPAAAAALSPSSSTSQLAGLGTIAAGIANPSSPEGGSSSAATLSSGQRKRLKQYLKRCRMNPRHSQLNLEGYLLLPVQRIPRYRLLVSAALSAPHVGWLIRSLTAGGARPE